MDERDERKELETNRMLLPPADRECFLEGQNAKNLSALTSNDISESEKFHDFNRIFFPIESVSSTR